jgi:MoaA/NifB/PqqE/SkfB family radical SAM enzyme
MAFDRIPFKLAARGIRFQCLKAMGLPAKPEALSMEVTRRCMGRCVMCNIWRTPATAPELEAADWLRMLASPVLSELKELDVTGGEPFLRNDIVELLLGIGRLKATRLKRLCSVAITTNGFLTDKILKDVTAVLAPLEGAGVTLVFACGFDAVGAVHDRIRNYEGGWEKLDATIKRLAALRQKFPSLILGIKTTVTSYNIDELDNVCNYADAHGLFTIISPYILTANRYANLEGMERLALSADETAKLRRFYNTPRFRWNYYRDELLRFLDTGRMNKPCSAGFNYFFIRSTGEFFPCPIIDHLVGNVKETPLEELLRSGEAASFRRHILDFPECKCCTEPGLERYALPFEGFHYLRQYARLGREEFGALHRHMGLDKYLR